MDKKTGDLILSKGKKFKKWSEGIFVNPFYWVENGIPYYIVVYTKSTGSVASAFFTLNGEETKADVMKAHPPLALFSDLSSNIFNFGTARSEVGTGYYVKPLAIPVKSEDLQVVNGRQAFADLLKFQQDYNAMMKDFTNYYDNDVLVREKLEESDITKVQETVTNMNILQYKIGTTLQMYEKDIEAFVAYLQTQEGWKDLDKAGQAFLKGITKDMRKAKKELDEMDVLVDENPGKMFQLNYSRMIERNKQAIENQKKNIRYPK